MVHFTLFGIPVYIRPSFWVVLAIFGGALSISSVEDLIYPALFVIAGIAAHRTQAIRCQRDVTGFGHSPGDIFDIGIQPAILMHDDHRRRFYA